MFHYPSCGRNIQCTVWSKSLCAPDDYNTIVRCTETFWSPYILVAWLRRGGLFRSIFLFVLTYFSVLRSNERPKHVVGSNKLHVKKCWDCVDWLVSVHPFSETSSVIIIMWILISRKWVNLMRKLCIYILLTSPKWRSMNAHWKSFAVTTIEHKWWSSL